MTHDVPHRTTVVNGLRALHFTSLTDDQYEEAQLDDHLAVATKLTLSHMRPPYCKPGTQGSRSKSNAYRLRTSAVLHWKSRRRSLPSCGRRTSMRSRSLWTHTSLSPSCGLRGIEPHPITSITHKLMLQIRGPDCVAAGRLFRAARPVVQGLTPTPMRNIPFDDMCI